jgi:hypothetical protein
MARISKQLRNDIEHTVVLLATVAGKLKAKQPFLSAMYRSFSEAIDGSYYGSRPSFQIDVPPNSKTIIVGDMIVTHRGAGSCKIEPDDDK